MNIATFLGHYQILENPFRAEEARHDSVFGRVETACHHPDYEKIRGDFHRPATSIVFGERGSGKTAIRLQIEDELAAYNREHPDARCLPLAYDELNPILDRFSRHSGQSTPLATLQQMQLVDHIDAMMSAVVPRIVDEMLGDTRTGNPILDLGDQPHRRLRQLDPAAKQDMMVLQICYDRPAAAASRTKRLKRVLRYRSFNQLGLYAWLAGIGAVLSAGLIAYFLIAQPQQHIWLWYVAIGLALLFSVVIAGHGAWLWWKSRRIASELSRRLRVMDRSTSSFRESLSAMSTNDAMNVGFPLTSEDDLRYAMFGRLLNVLRPFGYRSILILVDRVDEPTLINGEPDRMQAFVWPLLNNKFLQQDQVGLKLLLPLELRYMLNRETAEFYREARLDKQNLIERLTWSGATLYDLCSARLNACRPADAEPISLRDLFEDNVTAQDLVDALDQMQQPRDAFKFIYQLMQEHCANVPEEHPQFKIPRPVLDGIRKLQVERMSGMLRGVRPA